MELNNWIEKYINDEHTKEIYGKWAEEIAKENGYEEGSLEEKNSIAKNLMNLNIPLEKIKKATGLSISKLKSLK